ncbi:UDP-glucose 4-epimerase/UDP-sulfoquinovose synthase, putative [Ixodes scapularis]|uniref:UDP-glucose 4-epimerase n=1 Tax=Ixodes scapularis TaxID=6945 RepID=B7QAP2_IXOSC|nr:UDP-glucose 4-epimerase/UDP-sulfoquinovose synthase, putative [Ixodes scapularis]|eukprot:XP_002412618.1 UDP-glucose 4-epimerase/UDP-sulfoquinovose synthase, putative [Ixodes scapularis]
MAKATVFVTGGAGYVGSHTTLELLKAGYDVVVMDNYHNAHPAKDGKMPESLRRVQELAGGKPITFYKADLLDQDGIDAIFQKASPLGFFQNLAELAGFNAIPRCTGTPPQYSLFALNLHQVMRKHGVKRLIFSSSCTVYGVPQYLPLDEDHPTGQRCTNPYGRTKYFIEEVLKDVNASEKGWTIVLLRYFNPVGAHESGDIGEDPQGTPNNLMPYVSQVAIGRRSEVSVFGNDFDTPDGTGVRDYVHVVDLAKGHVVTLDKVLAGSLSGCRAFNLGTGRGFSVLEVIAAFEQASGAKIPYRVVERRQGDVDQLFAMPTLASQELGWKAEKSLLDMCKDMWNWQKKNPNGFLEANQA